MGGKYLGAAHFSQRCRYLALVISDATLSLLTLFRKVPHAGELESSAFFIDAFELLGSFFREVSSGSNKLP